MQMAPVLSLNNGFFFN